MRLISLAPILLATALLINPAQADKPADIIASA
jgi:hypothetical protein